MLKYYLIAVGVLSLITFLLYGIDKFKAKRNLWRVPEKVLLLFGFVGGALGGILGMNTFRHKTKHWYFYAVNVLGLIVNVAIILVLGNFINL